MALLTVWCLLGKKYCSALVWYRVKPGMASSPGMTDKSPRVDSTDTAINPYGNRLISTCQKYGSAPFENLLYAIDSVFRNKITLYIWYITVLRRSSYVRTRSFFLFPFPSQSQPS